MVEKLEHFLYKICDCKLNEIINLINCSKLKLLTVNCQKNIAKSYYYAALISRKIQARIYEVHYEALQEFLRACEESGLKPIFMKGIFLAAELYEEMGARSCGDIDVLIDASQFKEYDTILISLGYECDGSEALEKRYDQVRLRHIRYCKEVRGTAVLIEVHSSILNPPNLFRIDVKQFLLNTRQIEYRELKPYVLADEYNLIALMLHFFKHLPADYFQRVMTGQKVFINLLNLHDIALFVQKYADRMDWEKVLGIGIEMQVILYLLMTAGFVNEIYGEVFDRNFISRLEENVSYSWMETESVEGMGNFLWLMDLHMGAIAEMSIQDIISGRMPEGVNLTAMAADCGKNIRRFHEGDKLCFTERYKFCFPSAKDIESSVELEAWPEAGFLKIICRVENKNCICFEGEHNDPRKRYRKKDGVQVMAVKKDYIVHRLFTMAKDENGYYVICSSNNWSEVIRVEETDVISSFALTENGFVLELVIPWAFLDIDVRKERVVPFNVCAVAADPVVNATARTCNLFKGEGDFWDFRGIGGVALLSQNGSDSSGCLSLD